MTLGRRRLAILLTALLAAAGCPGPTAWKDREVYRSLQQDASGSPARDAGSAPEGESPR